MTDHFKDIFGNLNPQDGKEDHAEALKKTEFSWDKVRWGNVFITILVLALIVIGICIAIPVIQSLSTAGSEATFTIWSWFQGSELNPANKEGTARFFKLLLTAGIIGIIITIMGGRS